MTQLLLKTDHNGQMIDQRSIGGFHLTEKTYLPGARFPMHTHEHACLCLVTKGGYTEVYRDRRIECKPSQVNYRPPEEMHADHIGTSDVRCFIIEPSGAWLGNFQKIAGVNGPEVFGRKPLLWLALRVRSEFRQPDEFTPIAVEGLMLEIAAQIARGRKARPEQRAPRWLHTVRDMLHERFADNIALDAMAEYVGVHPVYLATTFRKYFDSSIGDYVRRIRIEYASGRLVETDDPIAEIALDAGFAHQPHFTRTFKRFTGFTPAEYRAQRTK